MVVNVPDGVVIRDGAYNESFEVTAQAPTVVLLEDEV
jgi:hypothetical protein